MDKLKNKPILIRRKQINPHQLLLLNTLYKFRFATIPLIAESQQANKRVIAIRIKILLDQDYIGINYDSSYKIKGRPASYYLKTKGVRHLRLQDYTEESSLRSTYHDKNATDVQIAHRLKIFGLYVYFKHSYPGRFKFYSKTEIRDKGYLPRQKPDAMLIDTVSSKIYIIDYLDDNMSLWTLRKTLKRLIAYAEMDIWREYRKEPHPIILFVCESKQLARKVKQIFNKELDNSFALLDFIATANIGTVFNK